MRLFHTVRHLRAKQVAWRARYTVERRLGILRLPAQGTPKAWDPAALERLHALLRAWSAHRQPEDSRAEAYRRGQFAFLGVSADFASGIDWVSAGRPRLWRYQLHYFEFARELALAPAEGDAQQVQAWMHDWIAQNPPGRDVAWDAFTVSARLLNWALAAAQFGLDTADVREAYARQTRYLARHLEHDVAANHLLKNACALCVAGCVLEPSVLNTGIALLREAVAEQILADGGHYERSPMYHALVLQDLLVTRAALGEAGDFLEEPIHRMARYLAGVLHPDGEIPLFGDSVFGETASPQTLLRLAQVEADDAIGFPESGFHVLRDAATSLHVIVKAGEPGPAYQLGHAHADFGSFEISLRGERVIVDTGVHGYADSPHRARVRAGGAHNTIEVEGFPQLETWSAFRVGRRYTVAQVTRLTSSAVKASAILPGAVSIERLIELKAGGLHVEDRATRPKGTPVYSHLHLAPGLTWEPRADAWYALRGDTPLLQVTISGAQATVTASQYHPRFGVTLPNQRLTLTAIDNEEAIACVMQPV